MPLYHWLNTPQGMQLTQGEQPILTITAQTGCTDTFEPLSDGAWRWTRRCNTPRDAMRMTVKACQAVRYWQVPAVNYHGNGWGKGAQYTGFALNGEPWTYAWHRVAIPACTYSESEQWCVSLFGEEKGGMSGSIWEEEGCACQALLWPEVEGPKVLSKWHWMEPYQGAMAPQSAFTAILFVSPAGDMRQGYHALLDFAWEFFKRPVTPPKTPEDVVRLDTLYFRTLWERLYDGVTGFQTGIHWLEDKAFWEKVGPFRLGYVGQNITIAWLLMEQYLLTGDKDLMNKAVSVLDSWMKFGRLPNGLMLAELVCDPQRLGSRVNGNIPISLDSCNLGVGATYLFKAAEAAEKCGLNKPEYRQAALDLCDFALRVQLPSGELAKSWFLDGSIDVPHGSGGMYMGLALFAAWKVTGDAKYLAAGLKAFDFYYGEFSRSGFTTAGALDSYCIDKESAGPLLRGALYAYHATQDAKYLAAAENVAYYLASWQWHYTIDFPADSVAAAAGFDTYGSTSVSAAHNALDHFGAYWVPDYLELSRLTGREIWQSRARALWYGCTQLISDGSLVINGKVRPAGSQDESVRHTRWGRTDMQFFTVSEWFTSYQGTFRQVALKWLDNWDLLR